MPCNAFTYLRSFIDSIERYGIDQTYANLLAHMTQVCACVVRALWRGFVCLPALVSPFLPLLL